MKSVSIVVARRGRRDRRRQGKGGFLMSKNSYQPEPNNQRPDPTYATAVSCIAARCCSR